MSQQHDLEGQIPKVPSLLTIDVKDWPKVFQRICNYIDQHRGLMGNQLSYCVRPDLKIPNDADDPSSKYASLDLEMIACVPILKYGTAGDSAVLKLTGAFDPTFLVDILKVNEILAVMMFT